MRSIPALVPAALVAVLLTGCAGQSNSKNAKDYKGDQKQIATVVDDLSGAARDRDGKELCTSILAPELAAKLTQGKKTCADIAKDQLKDSNVFTLDVTSIKVTGDTATVVVKSDFDGKDVPRTLQMRKVGTTWRIASIS